MIAFDKDKDENPEGIEATHRASSKDATQAKAPSYATEILQLEDARSL
jgi:hypothetical protein